MIKNCFNYVASKDRLLAQIKPLFDVTKKNFVDLFCGSGVVGVNCLDSFSNIHLNDGCWQVIRMLEYFTNSSVDKLLSEIGSCIKKYNLNKCNREGFLKARDVYNTLCNTEDTFNPILCYCLITHAFSYNIVFNKNGGFSVPSGAGRSYFNLSLRDKLIAFTGMLQENKKKLSFSSVHSTNFDMFVKGIDVSDTFFYVDPPYYISDSSCSRSYGLRWTKELDLRLLSFLDELDKGHATFALSNTIENNGLINSHLANWAEKYNIHDLDVTYDYCHHQRKNRGTTREVLITNY